MTRYVVIEPGAGGTEPDDAALEAVAVQMAEGCAVVHGWQPRLTDSRAPLVRIGRVRSAQDAEVAVSEAVAGARLVVSATADRDVVDQLCDDLRRLGDLDHRVGAAGRPVLTEDQRRLLAELLSGRTLGQAAQQLHLSRRTADRRLADARDALGVSTTAAALLAAVRLGIRPETRS